MNISELVKDLKDRKFKPVYLLHGEESYYIDKISDYIEQNALSDAEKGFNQTIFYGKDSDVMSIINSAKRFPMMSEFQVIIVKEAQDLKWGKDDEVTGNLTSVRKLSRRLKRKELFLSRVKFTIIKCPAGLKILSAKKATRFMPGHRHYWQNILEMIFPRWPMSWKS